MAAGEASVDICSLLGLELVCVVPVDFPVGRRGFWLGGGWRAEWTVLITSGKQQAWQRGGLGALAYYGKARSKVKTRSTDPARLRHVSD